MMLFNDANSTLHAVYLVYGAQGSLSLSIYMYISISIYLSIYLSVYIYISMYV